MTAVPNFTLEYEGDSPGTDIPALNLPDDGGEYVLVKLAPGNTIDAILKVVQLIPAIQSALQAKTLIGKIFGLMALAGQFVAIE